ncbi:MULTISPECIES: hypothetical protein [unclassified Cohnella]|uniref:hypothetical protein n=1 Tax=unclassified Cohnella TaxID=2636738 RepID=UPI001E643F37|nr:MULTISPECIES: hypothetical protein [unclassified Cohnella]
MAIPNDEAVNMMSVNREELKQLIDQIPEQDALAEDADLIRQVEQSREDRENQRIYGKEAGLDYLRNKVKEFEHGQDI